MRIVLLNQYYAPDEAATAQMLADLGSGLAAAGHDVLAIASSRSYADPTRRYPKSETLDGVRVRRVAATAFGRARRIGRLTDYATFLAGAAARLLFASRSDVTVVLSTPPLVATLGVVLSKLRRRPFVFWVMDVYPDLAFELGIFPRGSMVGRLSAALGALTLRSAAKIVALDGAMAERLRQAGGSRVAVVPNWADGEAIRPRGVEGHPLRRAWAWEGRFVILYSGNMGLAHEFDTVLEAAGLLRDDPSILFAFIGGGPRREEVEERARALGLPNVEFRPYLPRESLGESLTAGDVHLVTLRERMPGLLVPSKIYGILAAGRPTLYVGPAEGEIGEIVSRHDVGRRVAGGDARGLAEAVLGMARDAAYRDAAGARARALFEERYDRRRALAVFERILREAAAPAG